MIREVELFGLKNINEVVETGYGALLWFEYLTLEKERLEAKGRHARIVVWGKQSALMVDDLALEERLESIKPLCIGCELELWDYDETPCGCLLAAWEHEVECPDRFVGGPRVTRQFLCEIHHDVG